METGSSAGSLARASIQAGSPHWCLSSRVTIEADCGGTSQRKAYGSAFICR